ncbi:unnamed protein product [Adineta steineri]|uniref:Uncharacterized protein n=1 Tax=Adineta steineri TaxID=433720 RepID=A0A814L776_9BILA|nr:unnamed protein product [Adineta steineri]CAF1060371.1 unnamed protein product [Adineta steineri]CAF1109725.1 unnamed protein product [Adineta steineri]
MVMVTGYQFKISIMRIQMVYCQRDSNDIGNIKREVCGIENPTVQGGFYRASEYGIPESDTTCQPGIPAMTAVKGFFAGCTPFEGAFFTFLLITWLSTKLDTVKVWNPSLFDYNNLERLNSNKPICPCSTTRMPYHTFISLSPTLHQVCSSDFVSDRWVSVLKNSASSTVLLNSNFTTDWHYQASSQFQLLSNLCQLANKTIDDAIRRFKYQSFVAPNLFSEDSFNAYFNRTFTQLFQSTTSYFSVLVETERLLLQVDQLSAVPVKDVRVMVNSNLRVNVTLNVTTNKYSSHVSLS